MKGLLFAMAALICASAHSATINPNDAAAIKGAVTVHDDPYSSSVLYEGPVVGYNFDSGHAFIPNDHATAKLAVACTRSKHVCMEEVIVDVQYSAAEWRFITTASLPGGKTLEVDSIDRDVDDCDTLCSYDETVGVQLPDDFMKQHVATGFSLEVGQHVYAFTAAYVQGTLAAIPNSSPAVATGVR